MTTTEEERGMLKWSWVGLTQEVRIRDIYVTYMSYICHICIYIYTYQEEYVGGGGVQLKLNYSGQTMVVVKCFSNVAVC